MSGHRLEIRVTLRPGLLDPEGKAVAHALENLGFTGVREARIGKLIHLTVDADSREEAKRRAEEMCRKLLANPVTEDFEIRGAESVEAVGAGEDAR